MTGNNARLLLGRGFVVLLLCLCTGWTMAQANNTVTASVQPAQVTVGDSVTYEVTVNLTGSGQPSVAVPALSPDTGLSNPTAAGQQTSLESYIVNGDFRSVQRITYMYSIRTSKEGTFTIPPATVTINGKSFDTKPVQIEVRSVPKATDVPSELAGLVVAPLISGNPELQRKLTGVIFILPVLSKPEPYNGEQVRISYHLVIEPGALAEAGLLPRTNLDGVKIPPMNEFITEELYPFPQDLKFQERKIGGKLYLVAPVYEAVISSTKAGKLAIEPFQVSMIFSLRSRSGQAPSPFANDPFFSSLNPLSIMGGNSVQVIAQSPLLTLDVKPVPSAGRPADFAGAVGTFKMESKVDKKKAKAFDDTIALKVTVEGEGNTDSLSPPTLPSLPGFTVLGEPEQQTTGRKEDDDYISVKTFSYTLRPTATGPQTIPPIQMSYFEPEKEKFLRLGSDPIALEIAPGSRPAPAQAPPGPEDTPGETPPAEPDLRYISTEQITPPNSGLNRFQGMPGIAMFLLPPTLLAFAGAVAWRQKRSQNRMVDAAKLSKGASNQHLKNAQAALAGGHSRDMAAELGEGVRLHFASRFGITGAEATIPEIEERLTRNHAPAELTAGIIRILETCDSAQYANASIPEAGARQTYEEAIRLLKESEAFT